MRVYSHGFVGDKEYSCDHMTGNQRCGLSIHHALHLKTKEETVHPVPPGGQNVVGFYTEDRGKPLNHPVASEEYDETMPRSSDIPNRDIDLDEDARAAAAAAPGSDALQAWDEFSTHVRMLISEKDEAYGGAWREQGWMGNLARVMSMHSRLRNMMWRSEPTKYAGNEGVHDTLADLAALCAFMSANLLSANQWGRGAEEDQ